MRKANPREQIEIPAWASFHWLAFLELMNDRSYVTETAFVPVPGGTPIPIAKSRPLPLHWTTLKAFADHHGLSRDEFTQFVKLMRGMDMEFLTVSAEQAKSMYASEESDG